MICLAVADQLNPESMPSATLRSDAEEQAHKRFGTTDVPDAKRLKALEAENGRFKRLVAERHRCDRAMKEIAAKMVSVRSRWQQVGYARKRGLLPSSVRAVQRVRSSLRYL